MPANNYNTQTTSISGYGFNKQLPDGSINVNVSTVNALTALAGGGQTGATPLTANWNRITVCATNGDSALLPPAIAGLEVYVINSGAAYASIYPTNNADVIDGLAVNTSVSLPAAGTIRFLCTVTGTWNASAVGYPHAKFTTGTTTTTFAAGQLTGAGFVNYTNTGATPGSIATRTATQMFADDPYARVGGSYELMVTNGQGTGTLTMTAGSGVTLTGTATVAINTTRTFVVTYTSATALVIQNVGTGTFS